MDRTAAIQNVSEEIDRLAKMHILYGLERTALFQNQKERVIGLVSDYKINVRTELDPITRNLYRRYSE